MFTPHTAFTPQCGMHGEVRYGVCLRPRDATRLPRCAGVVIVHSALRILTYVRGVIVAGGAR